MWTMSTAGTLADVLAERDFYRRLLELSGQDELEPLLASALALIVEVTRASVAYLELTDDDGGEPQYWKGHRISPDEVSSIRASISRGIIARTIAEGQTLTTDSALEDERFADQGSVRQHAIQAVLCTPIGSPPVGVVYLQGRTTPTGFDEADRGRAELFARHLAPLADRLRARDQRARGQDHTRDVRTRFRCPQLVGTSRALAQVLQQAALVAPLDVDVLITGPAGTGKTALARALHDNSRRATGPFVAVNCAAIPETLFESEMFGAERGSHSMATQKTLGKVAAADGGTLFLDEIGDLSPGAQAKLLHLLQAREYHALGATKATNADIRVVTATNAELKERVAAKQFREDLYYRLHVLPLAMPSLADRRDDIPALVAHVCVETCRRHNLPTITASQRSIVACREAPWPGHVRELSHAIEAAVIRAHGDASATIHLHHIFPAATVDTTAGPATWQEATRTFQRRYLLEALDANDWNITSTARQLALARAHVYNLIASQRLRER